MPTDRRQARILAMQALCQWDTQRDESPQALADFFAISEASRRAARRATELVRAYWADRETVDAQIESAATKWALARLSPVDRNVMRVALVELQRESAPARVVVNEAIEIGREYGGADSPRFINGVLDAVLRIKRGEPEAED